MKTIRLAALAVLLFAAACNSGGEADTENVDTTRGNITPVENVNGNIPDTHNSITVGTPDTIGTPEGERR